MGASEARSRLLKAASLAEEQRRLGAGRDELLNRNVLEKQVLISTGFLQMNILTQENNVTI
jgi:hypothetical protein